MMTFDDNFTPNQKTFRYKYNSDNDIEIICYQSNDRKEFLFGTILNYLNQYIQSDRSNDRLE